LTAALSGNTKRAVGSDTVDAENRELIEAFLKVMIYLAWQKGEMIREQRIQ